MPRFAPLSEFLAEPLVLPVRGREYSIAPVDGETGLRLTARFDATKKKAAASDDPEEEVLDDEEEVVTYRMALGDTYDQMVADHVPYKMIKFVASAAIVWHIYGEKAAALFWETGGDPKWQPSDSAKALKDLKNSESQETPAAAPSTRKRASASGTTRSRKSPSKAQPGRTSSTAGT